MKKTEELYQTLVPSLKDRFYNQQLSYDEENNSEKPKINNTLKYIIYITFIFGVVCVFSYIAYNSYKYSKHPEDIESIPLVKKDITPIRTTPIEPGGEQFENQDKLIYDNIIDSSQSAVTKVEPVEITPTPVPAPTPVKTTEEPKPLPVKKPIEVAKKVTPVKPQQKEAKKANSGIKNPFDVLSQSE